MKKFILSIALCLLLLPTTLLIGCNGSNNNGINLPVYFEDKVTYLVYNQGSKVDAKLNDFTHNKTDNQVQYSSITFTGKPEWLYRMTIKKVTFDIYSNSNVEDFEFTITITNLEGAETTLVTSNTLTKTIAVPLEKNKSKSITLDVNDIVNSSTASTTIKLTFDSSFYKGDNSSLNFKLDVKNFKVFGEHKK